MSKTLAWSKKRIEIDFRALMEAKMSDAGRNITYEELSAKLGLSPRTIWRLYHGKAGRMKLLESLCNYFECPIEKLLVLKEDKS
jgi:DNA-binding Xre family transcriptional regulator